LSASSTDPNLLKYCSVVQSAPIPLAYHTILYKGKAAHETIEADFIQEGGILNVNVLATHAGGDFNHAQLALYWTEEEETAELYRSWAMRRCPSSETWLIMIQVPNQFLQSLRKQQLWYSMDWKEYIWHCKKCMAPPTKFDELWRRTDILRGHICTGVHLTRIKEEHLRDQINEDLVLKVSGRKAMQCVFMQQESIQRMADVKKGKVHIEITGPTITLEKAI